MKKTTDVNTEDEDNVGTRFRAERERIGLNQDDVGALCGVTARSVISWEQGSKIPADALATLMRKKNLDVFYVLGGARSGTPQPALLNSEEALLLDSFRSLSDDGRSKVMAYITAALDFDVRAKTARGVRERVKPKN